MLNIEEHYAVGVVEPPQIFGDITTGVKKMISLPGLRLLKPLAQMAAHVAEPPGVISTHTASGDLKLNSDRQELTVISANMWHDWPKFRKITQRLEAFAQMAERHQADVLLLQEVARTPDLWVAEWLAECLGMSFVYSRANGHRQGIGFEEGVAIFSRYPLNKPVLRQLSPAGNPFVHRLALGAQIASPLGDFFAFSVHLGINPWQNKAQAAKLYGWVEQLSGEMPALVGGDFNAGEEAGSILRLKGGWLDTFRHLNPFADGGTHEIRAPWGSAMHRARLDYIFLKANRKTWQVREAQHLETPGLPHSDHKAVLLRLAPAA